MMQGNKFQFPPPRGGRPVEAVFNHVTNYFNSRPRVGGDFDAFDGRIIAVISIPAPAWGATTGTAKRTEHGEFQFPPPRGGRRLTASQSSRTKRFQFPPPRGGRQCGRPGKQPVLFISIPAPAWGATHPAGLPSSDANISIPAPAWGATRRTRRSGRNCEFQFPPPRGGRRRALPYLRGSGNFNSRPRVGGDGVVLVARVVDQLISIPAPAWGATVLDIVFSVNVIYFNSRPRVGGDHQRPRGGAAGTHFNSRPRVGGDARRTHTASVWKYFNSRPRVGGDLSCVNRGIAPIDFNSRPRVGGDTRCCTLCSTRTYFNSRPRVGGDVMEIATAIQQELFQFPPPRGGRRPVWVCNHKTHIISIPAPAWGATKGKHDRPTGRKDFNSRPRVGGDALSRYASRDYDGIFQFPPPRGGRLRAARQIRAGQHISIPAPAWGATSMSSTSPQRRHPFQFPPPRGGRRVCQAHRLKDDIHFNSRPRVGGDDIAADLVAVGLISIPAPAWGATSSTQSLAATRWNFNSRPRVGGDRVCHEIRHSCEQFQFPPPRGGRPEGSHLGRAGRHISIPAPAWGATDWLGMTPKKDLISIPAPAWGATGFAVTHLYRLLYFNSRPRVGGDKIAEALRSADTWISIPAPAWGATVRCWPSPLQTVLFQFPPPRGGRPARRTPQAPPLVFQFPPPRGGRPTVTTWYPSASLFQFPPPRGGRRGSCAAEKWSCSYFNSRPRVGGDMKLPSASL